MRVWGRCGGQEVSFARDGARWTAAVPAGRSEYVVELWAEDDAGNVSYMATVLITYDVSKLVTSFTVLEVGAGWTVERVKAVLGGGVTVRPVLGAVDVSGRMAAVTLDVLGSELVRR